MDEETAPISTEPLVQAVLNSLAEGVVMVDADGRIVFLNARAEVILGVSLAEGRGRPLDGYLVLPSGRQTFLEAVLAVRSVQQIEVVASQREIILSVSCTPFQGNLVGAQVLVLRDLTETESAQRLRSYFLANVSHEFRTPLAALSASVELLLEDIYHLPREEIVSLLQSIHYSVTGLQTLIDNLLESVSIEAGRFRVRVGPASLAEVVREAVQVMAPLLNRRSQKLTLDISPEDSVIYVDATRIVQVLVNLLSNASKYSPLESEIKVHALVGDETLKMSVIDQGPGLSPGDRLLVFRRFIRLGDSTGVQYGAGLGLSVVKAIIEAHQGQVGVEENPGGGSVFWFQIPLVKEMA